MWKNGFPAASRHDSSTILRASSERPISLKRRAKPSRAGPSMAHSADPDWRDSHQSTSAVRVRRRSECTLGIACDQSGLSQPRPKPANFLTNDRIESGRTRLAAPAPPVVEKCVDLTHVHAKVDEEVTARPACLEGDHVHEARIRLPIECRAKSLETRSPQRRGDVGDYPVEFRWTRHLATRPSFRDVCAQAVERLGR